jgi:uncharacterized protein (DUF1501 family)
VSDQLFFSRRGFISRGAQLLAIASAVPMFIDRSARCLAAEAAATQASTGDQRVLVVVQLQGGNDGLNTIIPTGNDDYYRARPTLGIAKADALKLTDDFGVNPNADGLKKMYDAGTLAVVHAVGYPNPNRSHFRGTDIWTTAEPDAVAHGGWLGRFCESSVDQKAKAVDPVTAIALGQEPPAALIGKTYVPIAFRTPNELTYRSLNDAKALADFEKLNAVTDRGAMDSVNDGDHAKAANAPANPPGSAPGGNDETTHFLQQSALNARAYATRIQDATGKIEHTAKYPESRFAADMKLVAEMIASDLPTRVYYVKIAGFDTHGNQLERHAKLLAELGDGLSAFMDDLQELKQLDRVTVMTFSEFGRRVAENGAAGTDHGAAAPMFICGGKLNAGFHGAFPSLAPAKLNRGDIPYTTDFRGVYATVLQDWLRADPTAVLRKPFKTLDLYKA